MADALGGKLGTRVVVGQVDLGLLNRLIVDDVLVFDQQGDSMLCASRVAVNIDCLALMDGRISVTSAQLFGLKAHLYRATAEAPLNIQFALDSLASKDTTSHTPLDLHIGSLIVRHGVLSYDQLDAAPQPGVFSPRHIGLSNISAHLVVDRLTDSVVDATIKKLAFREQSGLQLDALHLKVYADQTHATLQDFRLQMPHTDLSLTPVKATYSLCGGKPDLQTIAYSGGISQSKLTPSDLTPLLPALRPLDQSVYLTASISGTASQLNLSSFNMRAGNGAINVSAMSSISDIGHQNRWRATIDNLSVTQGGLRLIAASAKPYVRLPEELLRLGSIHYEGTAAGNKDGLQAKGILQTDAGNADLDVRKQGPQLHADVSLSRVAVGKILDHKQLGLLTASIHASGTKEHMHAQGEIQTLEYNGYAFQGIRLDGNYIKGTLSGQASIADPKASLRAEGTYATASGRYNINAHLDHLVPSILGLKTADRAYALEDITLAANNLESDGHLDLEAPFADVHLRGDYKFTTIYQGVVNLLADRLPSLPLLKPRQQNKANDFTLQANISSTDFLNHLFGIPLHIESPIHVKGFFNEATDDISLVASAPEISYGETTFHGADIELTSQDGALHLGASLAHGHRGEQAPAYRLRTRVADDRIAAHLDYDNHSPETPIKGKLDFTSTFFAEDKGRTGIHVDFLPSEVAIGDTLWQVRPSTLTYRKDLLEVDGFAVSHQDQHVAINGRATPSQQDSIVAELKDVDVAYILSLVNFHSVEFAGRASGKAVAKSLLSHPEAYARLDVRDFNFENGPLGTLHASAVYNTQEGQIDISAVAEDGPDHTTHIDGYVSPTKNYIDLGIEARGTSMKFMENFCGSFMSDVRAWADGQLNLVGSLDSINLVGDINAHGSMHMRQLGTDYSFTNLRAHAIPDDILIEQDTIYDRDHHTATVSGGIHHKHLTRLSFDLDIEASRFLGFDTHEFGDNTFYGTIYATGRVGIHGGSGETVIDIDAAPDKGSTFVYNAASPDAISDQSFIQWHDITPRAYYYTGTDSHTDQHHDLSSDMHINFLLRTNDNLTLKLIMDPQSGDYITLHGTGVLRATYFDKGSFDMFGNYNVNGGTYKLTIQNLIKKDFEFMPGGTITFGGNPYSAPLKLQAKYVVSSVPLSDLSIGQSFSSNNIRVDCLMDITGTPGAPRVAFSMDLPTVSTDVKQMIYSVINSQEEMSQQVLYLLAIGRFYAQANNNQMTDDPFQQSQTALALQSLVSGTISQQLNGVLSRLIKNNNWNIGANISTGDDGWYSTEYEGILNGRMFNNRLLFNGQFGYRDNTNTTQNFIGDFDLRYLVFPSGILQLRMYNQTNDRYFTRNSLNTQGIGLIMKKDFNGLGDLFGIKRKKKKEK